MNIMNFFPRDANDSYLVDDDDENDSSECESSSEDEIDVLLNGTLQQRKKFKFLQPKLELLNSYNEQQRNSSSSEDEFEKEMNAELSQHISHLEKERVVCTHEGAIIPRSSKKSKNKERENEKKDAFYSDIYFDSDEEDHAGNKSHHAVLSNDDLLYDPSMDDRDQTWVDKQRQKHCRSVQQNVQSGQGKKATPRPSSDALLDCPACLTTVCIDCQRHATFKNQYRAMFVMNCVIDNTEKLQCPEQLSNSKKKKKTQLTEHTSVSPLEAPSASNSSSDLFNPVRCSECNTVVAVIDEDEVYHFFNIIASHT